MFGLKKINDEIEQLMKEVYEKGKEEGVRQTFDEKFGNNFLSEDELSIFNSYIDDCMSNIPFGNSDWIAVYNKITNGRYSKKSIERIESYRDY